MKNKRILRSATILFLLLMAGLLLQAQTQPSQESKVKAEYEKQLMEKELQLKDMELQLKKQQMEWEMQMKQQQMEQEKKTAELELGFAEQVRSFSRTSSGDRDRAVVYSMPTVSDEGTYFVSYPGQESQSQLTLRNTFNGETVSSEGEFDVDENTSQIRFTANGKVSHGEISITVLYPGGKVFKDLSINSSAQINFSQSLTINEEKKNKYVGTWSYEVKTKTAEGSYSLSIMTQ